MFPPQSPPPALVPRSYPSSLERGRDHGLEARRRARILRSLETIRSAPYTGLRVYGGLPAKGFLPLPSLTGKGRRWKYRLMIAPHATSSPPRCGLFAIQNLEFPAFSEPSACCLK